MHIKNHTKEKGSIIKVEVEISPEIIETHRKEALTHLGQHVDLKGFRKGHVPEKTLIEQLGELTILEEASQLAIEENYRKIIEELKISPIGHPKIIITKIAPGVPLEFTAEIPVMPEVNLPDYQKISKKIREEKEEEIKVEEKEIDAVLGEIKKIQNTRLPSTEAVSGNPPASSYEASRAGGGQEKDEEKELTDEFVKTLGDFKDLADFKEKVKENILKEKTFKASQKKRLKIIDAIRKETEIDIPEVLIESEINRMTNEFEHELTKIGSNLSKYLSEIKKTKEEISKDWRPKARERVETELILLEIKAREKIEVSKEALEKEVATLKNHYPDIDEERVKLFVEEMLSKEKVFEYLTGGNK